MEKKFWIDDIKQAWRFASIWVQGVGVAASLTWVSLTDAHRAALLDLVGITPDKTVAFVALGLFVAGIFARVKKQPKLDEVAQPTLK